MTERVDPICSESVIDARGIQVRYGNVTVLDDVSMRVVAGNTFVVLGNSGCGKTTLLKVLAGNLIPQAGQVRLHGQELQQIPATKRGVIYLDQEALLFEHLNIYENVAFALRLKKMSSIQIDARVQKILALISLTEHANKKSHQLSGGQKQRVAFARAILAGPKVLLLDEPFGSLDERTRAMMQELYKTLCKEFGITAVFVTHDIKEALRIGDRFGFMEEGKLYPFESKEDFMRDSRTGVMQELRFWESVKPNLET